MKIVAELLNVDGVTLAEAELPFKDFDLGDGTSSSELFVKTLATYPYEATLELPFATGDRRMWYSVRLRIDPA